MKEFFEYLMPIQPFFRLRSKAKLIERQNLFESWGSGECFKSPKLPIIIGPALACATPEPYEATPAFFDFYTPSQVLREV